MSIGWVLASIAIPTAVGLIAALTLCLAGRCDHTMFPNLHMDTGRIYYACRCGLRFDGLPSSGSSSSSPGRSSSPWSTR